MAPSSFGNITKLLLVVAVVAFVAAMRGGGSEQSGASCVVVAPSVPEAVTFRPSPSPPPPAARLVPVTSPPPTSVFDYVETAKSHLDFPDRSKPLLVLVTPADDPANLPRSIYHIIPLRSCFDVRWVIVHNIKKTVTIAPMFRDVFPWITELRAYHPASEQLSHQRNIGVEFALNEIVAKYGDRGYFYFLSTDNTLPDLCSVAAEIRSTSDVLFYREERQCGARVFTGSDEKVWSGDNALSQIACAAGEASFLIPLALLNEVRPKWHLTQHQCGIDPTFFAALVNHAVATKGAAAVQTWPQAFHVNQLHVNLGCVKSPWTQATLNASLHEYKMLLHEMENAQERLNRTLWMSVPWVSFHTYVHILSAIRSTLPADRTVQYLEVGIFKGATSAFMSRHPAPTNIIGVDYFAIHNQRTVANWMVSSVNGSNPISWISASSRSLEAIEKVRSLLGGQLIDICFIDGDHTTRGAMADFFTFSALVARGGYIVFDDFMDTRASSGVREAVWLLTRFGVINTHEYEIFGTIPNVAGASHWFRGGEVYDWQGSLLHNEFIIRKR
jgi:cephalosporin hydroxylase